VTGVHTFALPICTGRGVYVMEIMLSFIISVTAGVVAYYICKWLDGDE